ncbi:MAG TPA: sulfite exporter TauE/SafE family protein [Pirellulales bacterium]|nr:sulfite exporter TauE/SafE family protein [Pirellulales bacterium]
MSNTYLILCLAAAAAGAVNAIAGGGTLLTFPALFAALGSSTESAVVANATSTVALVPGALAALVGYRREIRQERFWTGMLFLPSLIGGIIGSLAVVMRPSSWFSAAVPWLILTAALLFALQPHIARWTGLGQPSVGGHSGAFIAGIIGFQFLVAIYGGYFGAGIGILMLSALALMGLDDIHRMNAVKSALNAVINGTSVVVFVASHNVHWPYALAMAVAASAGGFAGAHAARRIERSVVRALVVAIGFGLAAYYFYRQFWAQ